MAKRICQIASRMQGAGGKEWMVAVSEKRVVQKVRGYFENLKTSVLSDSRSYSIKTEYPIQMGSDNRRADVVLKQDLVWFSQLSGETEIVIAERKREGTTNNGIEQLQSYLCATDTRFGIFANSLYPTRWKYYENYGRNHFEAITHGDFEKKIVSEENDKVRKQEEIEDRINKAIEIRERELRAEYEKKENQLKNEYTMKEITLQNQLEAEKKERKVDFGSVSALVSLYV